MNEAFLSIPGYPEYALDTTCNVWSLLFRNNHTQNTPRLKKLSPKLVGTSKRKYMMVTLCNAGRRKTIGLHQIVAMVHHGHRPSKMHRALHIDDNQFNNSPSNIYWGTQRQNVSDCKRNGNWPTSTKGEACHSSKLTEQAVIEIRQKASTGCQAKDLATEYGVRAPAIRKVIHKQTWKHI